MDNEHIRLEITVFKKKEKSIYLSVRAGPKTGFKHPFLWTFSLRVVFVQPTGHLSVS